MLRIVHFITKILQYLTLTRICFRTIFSFLREIHFEIETRAKGSVALAYQFLSQRKLSLHDNIFIYTYIFGRCCCQISSINFHSFHRFLAFIILSRYAQLFSTFSNNPHAYTTNTIETRCPHSSDFVETSIYTIFRNSCSRFDSLRDREIPKEKYWSLFSLMH